MGGPETLSPETDPGQQPDAKKDEQAAPDTKGPAPVGEPVSETPQPPRPDLQQPAAEQAAPPEQSGAPEHFELPKDVVAEALNAQDAVIETVHREKASLKQDIAEGKVPSPIDAINAATAKERPEEQRNIRQWQTGKAERPNIPPVAEPIGASEPVPVPNTEDESALNKPENPQVKEAPQNDEQLPEPSIQERLAQAREQAAKELQDLVGSLGMTVGEVQKTENSWSIPITLEGQTKPLSIDEFFAKTRGEQAEEIAAAFYRLQGALQAESEVAPVESAPRPEVKTPEVPAKPSVAALAGRALSRFGGFLRRTFVEKPAQAVGTTVEAAKGVARGTKEAIQGVANRSVEAVSNAQNSLREKVEGIKTSWDRSKWEGRFNLLSENIGRYEDRLLQLGRESVRPKEAAAVAQAELDRLDSHIKVLEAMLNESYRDERLRERRREQAKLAKEYEAETKRAESLKQKMQEAAEEIERMERDRQDVGTILEQFNAPATAPAEQPADDTPELKQAA